MYKIAVMGERDSIYGFAAVGLDIYPVDDPLAAGKLLRALAAENYGIIYMTEALFAQLEREIEPYNEKPLPAIIPIPGASGNLGLGMQRVKRSVEKAVGADILFGES